MPYEITIKFNNRLVFTSDTPGLERFKTPEGYFDEAKRYHDLSHRSEEQPISNLFNAAWNKFQDWLHQYGLKPEYLFSYNPIDLPNQLWMGPNDFPNFSNGFPNFYNYFTIQLAAETTPEMMFWMLDELEFLLPHPNLGPENALLEYAYLKGDPQSLDSSTPGGTGGNQNYFTSMNLAVPPTGQGVGPTLTIVECDGWDLAHTQFQAPHPTLLAPQLLGGTLTAQLTNGTVIPDHGTKILGVLKARDTDRNQPGNKDLCKGIIPKATIRLCSCVVELTLTDSGRLNSKRYNEPDAVMAALVGTKPGDVMLIEVSSGEQKFPLDIQPAIFELFQVAYAQNVTVVEAAGNYKAYIGSQQNHTGLSVRNSAAITLGRTDVEHARTYWQSYERLKTQLTGRYAPHPINKYTSLDDFIEHYLESTSHAILVGATDGTNKKHVDSSWGERVQVYAQGVNINTTRPSNQFGVTQLTSGAAAIIAGVVMSLQSLAHSNGGFIKPDRMLDLLKIGGTLIYADSGEVIGCQPNYKAALEELNRNSTSWITRF